MGQYDEFLELARKAVGLKDKAKADKVVKLEVAPPEPDATKPAARADEKPARPTEDTPPPVAPIDSKKDKVRASADVATAPATDDGLPIYEATEKEINLWHAYGSLCALQDLLRKYRLDNSSPNVAAYNYFKVGFDMKAHRATFAIDATHYLAIDFNEYNSAPLNKAQVGRVLEKIGKIRNEKARFYAFVANSEHFVD